MPPKGDEPEIAESKASEPMSINEVTDNCRAQIASCDREIESCQARIELLKKDKKRWQRMLSAAEKGDE